MNKYRLKSTLPEVIDAIQWCPDKTPKGKYKEYTASFKSLGIQWNGLFGKYWFSKSKNDGAYIISSGDWIIIKSNGERSLCKPDVFKAMYEFVGETAILNDPVNFSD